MNTQPEVESRHVTAEPDVPRFSLYRLCQCTACDGKGKAWIDTYGSVTGELKRCPECRGEGRIRQELAACDSPEAVGVALVTLAREGEWLDADGNPCAFGLLDREPPCETCGGSGDDLNPYEGVMVRCHKCKGSGIKPTATWLILPWQASARNVTDAARTLARSKKTHVPQ